MATAYDDQKRAAVLAALLAGQSVSQIARDYRVSRQAIMAWRDKAGINPAATPVRQQNQDEIAELVGHVLRSFLDTISVLAQHSQDPDWFKKQSASDIAVLAGVLTDKTVRILEALESASPDEDPAVDTAPAPEAA